MRVGGILVAGATLLAGCMSAQSSGVVSLGAGLLGVTVVSRDLSGAASRAMGDAAGFCAGVGRQAELVKTEVSPADYRLTFRCKGTPQPILARVPVPAGAPVAGSSGPAGEDAKLPSLASTLQRIGTTPEPVADRGGLVALAARVPAPAADDVWLPSLAETRQRIGAVPLPAAVPAPPPTRVAVVEPAVVFPRLPPVAGQPDARSPPGQLVPAGMAVPPAGFWNLR